MSKMTVAETDTLVHLYPCLPIKHVTTLEGVDWCVPEGRLGLQEDGDRRALFVGRDSLTMPAEAGFSSLCRSAGAITFIPPSPLPFRSSSSFSFSPSPFLSLRFTAAVRSATEGSRTAYRR